ncbi:DoxX protein [Nostoc linckia z18]|uniref:DoxX protein n=2 Tax=Nostoc linckia TaxID=92942 RepID=A0A9Q6EJ81_NOSLI|nr:DoxX family membrane protein [Nostoc linckia]PHK38740.1 DoxX protein [Nostoc linckia z15]PHK44711.1 DoxX protein [Nostoc linckia z16]PHJ65476.1 DoxX protein [Nostoc linckia z1]PHJ70326.1 DoxX protein [Nostoc linckia z3]PHJ76961.1 DoxX protein [Nostoc linckia z2]
MKYLLNLRTAVVVSRVMMGVFFFLSGVANYLNFSVNNGFYQTVLIQKLQIIGPGIPAGWQGLGPLPWFIAIPYAWLLPLAEILLGALFALNYWMRWTGLLLILVTFSITLAFGIIPAGSLFPNGAESFNKTILFMALIWICIAYDAREQKMSRRRSQAAADYVLNASNNDM